MTVSQSDQLNSAVVAITPQARDIHPDQLLGCPTLLAPVIQLVFHNLYTFSSLGDSVDGYLVRLTCLDSVKDGAKAEPKRGLTVYAAAVVIYHNDPAGFSVGQGLGFEF